VKLHITLEASKIDPDGVKGEEFDEELESQLEDLDVEGWEFSKVQIDREKPVQKAPWHHVASDLAQLGIAEGGLSETTKAIQLDDVYPENDKYTWRQMVAYWAVELGRGSKSA